MAMLGGWLGAVACATSVGCVSQAAVPISPRSAAHLRQTLPPSLGVRLTLARHCVESLEAHPLPPAEHARLRAAIGPAGGGGDVDALLCWRAVGAFLDWELSPGTLHRLEAGEPSEEDLEILSAVLAPDRTADPI
jgi:hypothetical protein